MKLCPRCMEEKPKSEFYKNAARHDGLTPYCRVCHYAYRREMSARQRQDPAWLAGHQEKRRQRDKAWYKKTRDRRVKLKRKSRENNREGDRAAAKRWREKNPERYRGAVAESKRRRPEKYREIGQRKRARKLGQLGTEFPDITELYELQSGKCYYCSADLALTKFHEEHKIPLCRGGLHSKENVCLSCPLCNSKKGSKTEAEFLEVLRNEFGMGDLSTPHPEGNSPQEGL